MKHYQRFLVTGAYYIHRYDQIEELYEEVIYAQSKLGAFRQSIFSGIKSIYGELSVEVDYKSLPIADWLNWDINKTSKQYLSAFFKNYGIVVTEPYISRSTRQRILHKENVLDTELIGELF